MKLRSWLIAAAVLTTTSCATPDVKPFADQTSALETAVATEKKAVADKMDSMIALIEKGNSTKPASTLVDMGVWEKHRKSYLESMAVVIQVLSEATAYSDAVASLAAAGETGSAAAEKIYGTVQGFASVTASLGGPGVSIPADFAGSVAGRVFKEIGDLWARYEAQQSLTEATEKAHPTIIKIGEGVDAIFRDIQPRILFASYNQMKGVETDVLLTGAAKFHKNYGNDKTLNALLRDVSALPLSNIRAEYCLRGFTKTDSRIRCFGRSIDAATKDAILQNDSQRLDSLTAESEAARHRIQFIYFLLAAVNETEKDHDQFLEARADTEAWYKTRTARAKAIAAAAQTWVKTHEELTVVLANCSGLKSLKASCGNLTAANLKASIERINLVVGDDFVVPGLIRED